MPGHDILRYKFTLEELENIRNQELLRIRDGIADPDVRVIFCSGMERAHQEWCEDHNIKPHSVEYYQTIVKD